MGPPFLASAFCADPSLQSAEEQCDTAIHSTLIAECTTLRETIKVLHHDNATLHKNNTHLCNQHNDVNNNLHCQCKENSNLKRQAQETINNLCNQASYAEDTIEGLCKQITKIK
jgi:hypothetical protein